MFSTTSERQLLSYTVQDDLVRFAPTSNQNACFLKLPIAHLLIIFFENSRDRVKWSMSKTYISNPRSFTSVFLWLSPSGSTHFMSDNEESSDIYEHPERMDTASKGQR